MEKKAIVPRSSSTQTATGTKKIDIREKKHCTQNNKDHQTPTDRYVRYPEKTIPKTIDHIQNRIPQRNMLPEWWQNAQRIKHSAEIGEWRQNKCRNNRHTIKIFGIHTVQQSCQRKQQCREKNKE